MKKLIILISIITIISWGILFWVLNENTIKTTLSKKNIREELSKIEEDKTNFWELKDNNEIIFIDEKKTVEDIKLVEDIKQLDLDNEKKIETLRKRFTLRWTITRWDNFTTSNQPILALNEYLKALRQSPDDSQIIKKISWVYFELKRYTVAIQNFEKILNELNNEEKEKYILSLIYTLDFLSKESYKNVLEKIDKIWLTSEEVFYYKNSLNCSVSFHECKKNFQNYIDNNELTFNKLIDFKNTLINFKNFQIPDLYYKDALIIWSLYKNKLYNISNNLWEKLLQSKTNYKPILLIIWKWYYEIWNLEESKKYLEIYYNLEPNDVNITYILWNINFELKDYLTSNLYYNRAFKNLFEPKIEVLRKMIYNYYLLWDKRSMLNMFSYLIEEKNATIDDFSLWIYWSILEGRDINAISWSEKWINNFKEKSWYEIFYWYLWWIYREKDDLEKASNYINTAMKINPKDPLITLNAWYIEELKENYKLAIVYFKRTININWDGEFWELANKEIQEIEKYLKSIEVVSKEL